VKARLPDLCKKTKSRKIYQNGHKPTRLPKKYTAIKIPNGHEVPTPKFSIPRPSKIYQKWHFWPENIPSGNPEPGSFATFL
jgi:hypothetical protein